MWLCDGPVVEVLGHYADMLLLLLLGLGLLLLLLLLS
jgi:hypothetical protein